MAKKLGLIWANPYSGNRGVGALTYSILYLLQEIAREKQISFQYYIIGTASNKSDRDAISIFNDTIYFQNLRCIIPIGIRGILKSIVFYKDYHKYSKLDFVLDISEGDSFTDIYGEERFSNINSTKKTFIKKQIPQLLLPQTIGPFNNPVLKKEAVDTIEHCTVVLARDKQSFTFLQQETDQKYIDEVIDVAFFMPFERKKFSTDFIHVGLNISALIWNGGYTQNNQFDLQVDYHQLIHSIVRYFLSLDGVKLHLVSHVVDINKNVENDYAVCTNLFEDYQAENLVLAPFFLTPIAAKNYIAGFDFFAGARMHATIAAFSSGVPVFPMAYSRKFNGLFLDTLSYPFMGDMLVQNTDEIFENIKKAYNRKTELQELIRNRMDTVVSEKMKMLKNHLIQFLKLNP